MNSINLYYSTFYNAIVVAIFLCILGTYRSTFLQLNILQHVVNNFKYFSVLPSIVDLSLPVKKRNIQVKI